MLKPNLLSVEGTNPTDSEIHEWLNFDHMPPWRRPNEAKKISDLMTVPPMTPRDQRKGQTFVMPPMKVAREHNTTPVQSAYDAINAALMLRRPILLKGEPGIGKSSVAYFLAHRLGLGKPLVWAINSKSTLKQGLYTYDAVGHLGANQRGEDTSVYEHISLNPLGEALLPWKRPRVLLIDELDKASYDLPNDLLHILEEGSFVIPEIRRSKEQTPYMGSDVPVSIEDYLKTQQGHVEMYHPPVMVITSNNEREFSDAFKRRCVVIDLQRHEDEELKQLLKQHLPNVDLDTELAQKVLKFKAPTDTVLQVFYLMMRGGYDEEKINGLLHLLDRK